MAVKNKEFLDALNNTSKLRKADKADRANALEALLAADASNQSSFENAMLAHKTFWGTIEGSLGGLTTRPKVLAGYDYLEETDATNTFKSMQQAAAEQRVKFALAGAPQDVLIGLVTTDFNNNGTVLRQYLETKQNSLGLNFSTMRGWDATNDNLLTQTALAKIRTEAANQLLIQLMAVDKPALKNPKLFDDLVKATNIGEFKTAAKALVNAGGITLPPGKTVDDILDALDFQLKDEVVAEAVKRSEALLDQKAITEFEGQFQKFISKATGAEVLATKDFLKEADSKDFLDELVDNLEETPQNAYRDRIKDLEDGKKDELGKVYQQKLSEHYLKAQILSVDVDINDGDLIAALKAANKSTLNNSLDQLVTDAEDKAITMRALTDDNATTIKIALTKNIINKLSTTSTQLDMEKLHEAAGNLEKFKTLMAGKVGDPNAFDFLKKEDLPEIRKALREQLELKAREKREQDFTAAVEKSRLGAAAHQELIEVFKELPNAKQEELLKDNKHEILISAKTVEELKFHLGGQDAQGRSLVLTDLANENQKAALFKKIHNPEIAKVLAGFSNPRIVPDEGMINQINAKLLTHKDLDLALVNNLKTVVDDISTVCIGAANTNADFYKAFGFTNEHATAFDAAPAKAKIKDNIKDAHNKNRDLFTVLAAGGLSATQERFVQILLRVAGKTAVSINNASVDMNSKDNVQKIYEHTFAKSATAHAFLDKLIPEADANNDTEKRNLKNALSREFTPEVFSELKGKRIETMLSGSDTQKQRVIKDINEDVARIEKARPSIEKHKGHLKNLATDLASLPGLFSGANEVKAKNKATEIKQNYQELSKQCDTILEHLAAAQRELKVYRDKVPKTTQGLSDEVAKEVKKLSDKLDEEIKQIETQLAFYEEVQKQINGKDGTIAQIDKIVSRQATVIAESKDNTTNSYSVIDKTELKTATHQKRQRVPDDNMTGISTNIDENSINFKVQDIPQKGQVLCVDTTHTKDIPGRGPKEFTGRFIVDYHPEGEPRSVLSGKETPSRPVKVSIVKGFDESSELAGQMMDAAKALLKDWDGKSPIRLKGVNGGPQKDKELRYLWTAVCVLGEHHPKFSRDKIEIRGNSPWRPDAERNWKGYTSNSAYTTVFKGSAKGIVDEKVEEFKALVDPKKRNEADKSVKAATTLFRDKLSEGRSHDIATKVEQDVKVQGPRVVLGGSGGND
ncbi:interaptin [Fluoribacter dumoffii]|uniref:interaptin n=1 Tax=Fluoribacter dumoffii TaxID=463 RepID=UPI00224451F9|nr:interaptin [Fluoribacter dumoffii]MCW8417664.1 interaptin [Fluoribacter dumoffii]MCW8454494.1 interaptin [Fluoribacter dumoffii]